MMSFKRWKMEDGRRKAEGGKRKTAKGTKNFVLLVGILLGLFIVSCQDVKKPNRPENLIAKDKMASIMIDFYITNAARSINNKLLKKTGVQLDSLLYAKYSIDSLQFAESNAFYSANLKAYEEIMKKVSDSLTLLKKEKDSVYTIIKKHKEDSLVTLYKENPKLKPTKKDNKSSKKLVTPVQSN